MNYCADCCELVSGTYDKSTGKWSGEENGMYKCEASRKSGYEKVYACMKECPAFREAFNYKRSKGDAQSIYTSSSRHHYYLTTFICETLKLEETEAKRYMNNMAYMKDIMLPLIKGGNEWVAEYNKYCPQIIEKIKNSGNCRGICEDLYKKYLRPFNYLFENSLSMDEAFEKYDAMFKETKREFLGIEEGRKMN